MEMEREIDGERDGEREGNYITNDANHLLDLVVGTVLCAETYHF